MMIVLLQKTLERHETSSLIHLRSGSAISIRNSTQLRGLSVRWGWQVGKDGEIAQVWHMQQVQDKNRELQKLQQ